MLDDDLTDAEDLARVAATDPALTARTLDVANSAFYQQRTVAATIRDAFVVLGSREVRSIVVASCLLGASPRTNAIIRNAFWRFSFVVGMLADIIARSRDSWTGEAFTAAVMPSWAARPRHVLPWGARGRESADTSRSAPPARPGDRGLWLHGRRPWCAHSDRLALPETVVHAIA